MSEPDLDARIRALEARLRELEREADAARPSPPAPPAPPASPPAAAPPRPPAAPPARPPAQALQPPRALARPPRDLEAVLGASWLARAGVLVLALGIVFFIKLAFDYGWIGLRTRIVLGFLLGLTLFAAGDVMRNRRIDPAFAQVLAGGGAVIAYISLYLAYALPDYRAAFGLTLEGAVLLLALTGGGLAGYAWWRNQPLLAGVAQVLGIVLLAPAGDFSNVGLLYALLLSGGILVASSLRGERGADPATGSAWSGVVLLSLLGGDLALLLALAWEVEPALVATLAVAHATLAVVSASRVHARANAANVVAFLAPLLLAPLLGLSFHELGYEDPGGWAVFGTAVVAAGGAFALPRLARPLGGAAGLLLLLWPPLHFDIETYQVPLAYEGLMALGIGLAAYLRRARDSLHGAAFVAGLLALVLLWTRAVQGAVAQSPALSTWVFLLLAALGLALWRLRRDVGQDDLLRRGPLALAVASPVLLVAHLFAGWGITVAWALLGFGLVGAGFALQDRDLRLAAFGIFGLALLRLFTIDLASLSTVYRVLTFILTGVLLLGASFLYARGRTSRASSSPDAPAGPPQEPPGGEAP